MPVDDHVRGITARLFGEAAMRKEATTEIVESFWQRFCEEYDFVPIRINQPLRLIERDWDEWGRGHVKETLEGVR